MLYTLAVTLAPATSVTTSNGVLDVQGLTACREGRVVLRDVDLQLAAGTCMALVGPNGGGKTTFLRAVLGWLPTSGVVRLAGLDPETARRRGDVVGYVPQRPHVPAALPMSARQAVRLAAPPGRQGKVWADHLLSKAMGHTCEALDHPVTRLSGGQLQQVFLARALAARPQLLLLDEPTVGLDNAATDRLLNVLALARDELNTAVLIATHDHLIALRLTDQVAYLDVTIKYCGPANAIPHHLDAHLCHHE